MDGNEFNLNKKFLIRLSIGLLTIAYHKKKISDKELSAAEKYLQEKKDK